MSDYGDKMTKKQMDVIRADFYSNLATLLHSARNHIQGSPWCLHDDIAKHQVESKVTELCDYIYKISWESREAVRKMVHLDD